MDDCKHKMDGLEVSRVRVTKFLGVLVDEKLSWSIILTLFVKMSIFIQNPKIITLFTEHLGLFTEHLLYLFMCHPTSLCHLSQRRICHTVHPTIHHLSSHQNHC